MRSTPAKCLSAAVLAAILVPALAQAQALTATVNGHEVMSAPVSTGGSEQLLYEVCNKSGDAGAFLWDGPGYGVGKASPLPADFCARKRLTAPHGQIIESDTRFRTDGRDSPVRAHLLCPEGMTGGECSLRLPEQRYESVVEHYGRVREGEPAARETLRVVADVLPDGGCSRVVVSSSRPLEAMYLVFPGTDSPTLAQLFTEPVEQVEIETLGHFADGQLADSVLRSGLAVDDAAVRVNTTDASVESFREELNLRALRALRDRFVALAPASNGLALRNDVDVCTK